MTNLAVVPEAPKPLKLDLGCGPNKCGPDWTGVDAIQFGDKVDVVCNLSARDLNGKFLPWPWETESVDEIHASHFIEHLDAEERVHFVNEAHRVLKMKGQMHLVAPHWCSTRAYGDLTHKWPPVCEMWFWYLDKNWRAGNAPHNSTYTCDFEFTQGYTMRQDLTVRHQDHQQWMLQNAKEAAQDTVAHLTKR